MPAWMHWFQIFYPIAMTLTPVLLAIGLLWLKTKFAALGDLKQIDVRLTGVETTLQVMTADIKTLDEDAESEPTRMQLLERLSEMAQRMGRMEAAVEGERRQSHQQYESLRSQLATNNQYLHTLVEQGMRSGGQ